MAAHERSSATRTHLVHGRLRGGTVRLGRGVALALAATVVLAIAAAQLGQGPGRPPPLPAAGARPSGAAGPTESAGAEAPPTSMPAATYVANGPPPVGQVLARAGVDYRELDLATGRLGPLLAKALWPGRAARLPDGTFVTVEVSSGGTRDRWEVDVAAIRGEPGRRPARPLISYSATGTPPAADGRYTEPIVLAIAIEPAGRRVVVGRSIFDGPAWRLGLDVVELETGRLRQSIELGEVVVDSRAAGAPADRSQPPAPTPEIEDVYVGPPNPTFSPDGRTLLLSSRVTRGEVMESRGWTAPYVDGSVGRLLEFGDEPGSVTGADCEDQAISFLDTGRVIAQCWSEGASSSLLRVAGLDGRSVHDARPADAGFGDGWVRPLIVPGGRAFLWDPQAARLGRLDPDSGAFDVSDAFATPMAALDWGALLAWIAPPVQAKILLEAPLAVSPDGGTLYALGATFDEGPQSGWSTGVYVIDPETLALQARWAPTADYNSIAVTPDGRYVVLAGAPGGSPADASVTVVDAASGDVRAFAPGLGADWLVFGDPNRGEW